MAVEKMKLVNIVGPLGLFDEVVRDCIVDSGFAPENVLEFVGVGGGLLPFTMKNPSSALLSRAETLCADLHIEPQFHNFTAEQCDESRITLYFDELSKRYSACTETIEKYKRLISDDEQILSQLDKILDVKANLDDLFDMHFAKLRFGRVPRDIYDNYERYIDENEDIYFFETGMSPNYIYGMYLTPRPVSGKSDALFSSLHFERIMISDRVHGAPAEAKSRLEAEMQSSHDTLRAAEDELSMLSKTEHDELLANYCVLKYYRDTYDMRRFSAHTNDTFYLCGWVPSSDTEAFAARFEPYTDSVYVLEEPASSGVIPPTKLKNRGIFRFFEQFVEMYGLPSYNELDPTKLLAISYTLFFGVMFGDVGQGAVLVLTGLLAWKLLKMPLGKIISVIGCSSIVFGFIYGSVFGNEDLLPGFKLFETPNNTNIILISAVAMGLIFVSVAMIFNIYNGIKQHNMTKALFSQNGLAGFIFYWAIIIGVLCTFMTNVKLLNPLYISLLIVVPLILIFLQGPLGRLVARKKDWAPKRKGEYVIENFFEVFEILLSFLSNTISFVRIGAFALNHVGMMLVVFALMDSVGAAGSAIVFVIGNIFVICLEGLIVGIQVLRLEFYELFGRFYDGNGVSYKPFKIDFSKNKN